MVVDRHLHELDFESGGQALTGCVGDCGEVERGKRDCACKGYKAFYLNLRMGTAGRTCGRPQA